MEEKGIVMILKGKQKRYLRSLANTEKAIFQIGKDGVSYNLIAALKDALRTKELIKISLLKSCDEELEKIALELSAQTGSEIVQIIGRTVLLYKPNRDLGEKRIILP